MRYFIALALLPLLIVMGIALNSAAQARTPQMCTMMWCDEGTTVAFDAAAWPAGEYKIDLGIDGAEVSCTAVLPLPPCGQDAFECSRNDAGVMVVTEGCALPADVQKLGGLRLNTVPQQLSVKVAMPDGAIRDMSSAVEGHCGFPNGEQCDERQCCSASLTFSLK